VDRSVAPWRVLEAPDPDNDPQTQVAGSADDRDGIGGIPVPWLVAGAVAIMVALALVGVILAGAGTPTISLPGGSAAIGAETGPPGSPGAQGGGEVVVEVAGAVAQPGLYHLAAGQRVADAIAAAGGYGPRVDAARATAQLNLAQRLKDGDRIVVPSRDDQGTPPGAGAGSSTGGGSSGGPSGGGSATGPVDLNKATSAELDGLPGIGPVTAAKIISSREEQPFGAVEDLRTRKLVGASTFEKLRDLVTVR
jgi:competence protein ComEA